MTSMNKYNRLMEHVNPSPDMEQRLHAALDQSPVRKPNPWRCSIPFAAAGCLLAIIFSIATIKPAYAQTAPDHTKPPVTATAPQDYNTTDALALRSPSRWRCRRPCRMAMRSTRHPISSAWLLLCMRTRKDIPLNTAWVKARTRSKV